MNSCKTRYGYRWVLTLVDLIGCNLLRPRRDEHLNLRSRKPTSSLPDSLQSNERNSSHCQVSNDCASKMVNLSIAPPIARECSLCSLWLNIGKTLASTDDSAARYRRLFAALKEDWRLHAGQSSSLWACDSCSRRGRPARGPLGLAGGGRANLASFVLE